MKLSIVKMTALMILAASSAAEANWSCDCRTTDWYEDGSEAVLVAEGTTKADAIRVCKTEMNGTVVAGSCASLGRGDR